MDFSALHSFNKNIKLSLEKKMREKNTEMMNSLQREENGFKQKEEECS